MIAKFFLLVLSLALAESFNGFIGNGIDDPVFDPTIVEIAGGIVAPPTFASYVVSLRYKPKDKPSQHVCGGTLINKRWVLTSARCATIPKIFVVSGEHNLTAHDKTEQVFGVDKVIPHPGFDIQSRPFRNDIALVKLSRDAKIDSYTRTIRLAAFNDNINPARCFVAGWGETKLNSGNSELLMHVEIPILENEFCSRPYKRGYLNSNRYICAGSTAGDKGFCWNDEGGPLSCYASDGAYELAGVASYQNGCVEKGFPGVYMNVEFYNSWVKRQLAEDFAKETIARRMGSTLETKLETPLKRFKDSDLKSFGVFLRRMFSTL